MPRQKNCHSLFKLKSEYLFLLLQTVGIIYSTIHIVNLTQSLCIPKHFSHYVLTEISETDIHDHPKLLSDRCIKKILIICQTLGVGQYMKFILMRLVFPINEKRR